MRDRRRNDPGPRSVWENRNHGKTGGEEENDGGRVGEACRARRDHGALDAVWRLQAVQPEPAGPVGAPGSKAHERSRPAAPRSNATRRRAER